MWPPSTTCWPATGVPRGSPWTITTCATRTTCWPCRPAYSIALGMYAFGLEETADYARAEATGRQALEFQPLDCWAHHAVALDMIDASALLWRLTLVGQDVGERWQELADAWDDHADGRLYPFNDWHAVMAYLGAGRDERVAALLAALRAPDGTTETTAWARRIGLPPGGRVRGLLARRPRHGGRAPASGTLHRQRLRRQPCPARHHRLDADRGRPVRRPSRPGRRPGPRAPGAQAAQPHQPRLPAAASRKINTKAFDPRCHA